MAFQVADDLVKELTESERKAPGSTNMVCTALFGEWFVVVDRVGWRMVCGCG